MLCAKCGKNNSESNLKHFGSLCRFCFCALIEKRARKYIRISKFFRKNDKLLIVGDLCFYLVQSIIKGLPVKIVKISKIKNIKGYKTVIPWTLDDEVNSFLGSVFSNKKTKENDCIKLLKTITDEEAALFARFKNIKFTPNKKNKDIQEMLDRLEERYPGSKFGLLKSSGEIKEIR